jgi:hypothetical protein
MRFFLPKVPRKKPSSMPGYLLPRPCDLLWIGVLFGIVSAGPVLFNSDGDLGRHITVGNYIPGTGTVPGSDIFTGVARKIFTRTCPDCGGGPGFGTVMDSRYSLKTINQNRKPRTAAITIEFQVTSRFEIFETIAWIPPLIPARMDAYSNIPWA